MVPEAEINATSLRAISTLRASSPTLLVQILLVANFVNLAGSSPRGVGNSFEVYRWK